MKVIRALAVASCVALAHGDQMHLVNDFEPWASIKGQGDPTYITRFTERKAAPWTAHFIEFMKGKRIQMENRVNWLLDSMFGSSDSPRVSFLYLRTLEDTTYQEIRIGIDELPSYEIFGPSSQKDTMIQHSTYSHVIYEHDDKRSFIESKSSNNVFTAARTFTLRRQLHSVLKAVEEAWGSRSESQRLTYATKILEWVRLDDDDVDSSEK